MLIIENMSITRGTEQQSFTVSLPQLQVTEGEVIAIQGMSGCGKSTLLEMIGLILQPDRLDRFEIETPYQSIDIRQLTQQHQHQQLAQIRAKQLGFMLQNGGLLPFLTIAQNIALPNELLHSTIDQHWISSLCEQLHIQHLLNKYPKQLSIGERQRVAFIRAIAHKPSLLLADEPTSALDPHHANTLFDLMLKLAIQQKIAILLVTHDWELTKSHNLRIFQADLISSHQAIFKEKRRDQKDDTYMLSTESCFAE